MAHVEVSISERPILFSAPMVQAILNGRKTQTRRILKSRWFKISEDSGHLRFDPDSDSDNGRSLAGCGPFDPKNLESQRHACSFNPYGQAGDRLWVRETWRELGSVQRADGKIGVGTNFYRNLIYRADGHEYDGPWRPSIYMPRKASRITLEIINIRVEQLQEITREDAAAEGMSFLDSSTGRHQMCDGESAAQYMFQTRWDSLNAKRGYSWESNPWVWVIEFKKL